MQGGAADDLDARLAYFVQKQSNDGCFVLDKDSEDLVKLETSLGGVTDIVRQSLEFVAAIFRLPVTKFLGVSPAGFNPTGEAERRNLYDYLAGRQEKVLRAPLQRALEVLQMDVFGGVDARLTFDFAPLDPEDDGGSGGGGGGGKTPLAAGGPTTAILGADKNDFKESDHPRDKDGKFAKGAGGGGSAGGGRRNATTLATAPAAGKVGEGEEELLLPAAPPAETSAPQHSAKAKADINKSKELGAQIQHKIEQLTANPTVAGKSNEEYHAALAEAAGGTPVEDLKTEVKAKRFFILMPLFEDMGKDLDVDPDFLMALASYESGWFNDHNTSLNNLFGVTEPRKDERRRPNKEYDSLQECIAAWKSEFGERVRGVATMEDYIKALRGDESESYNSVNTKYDQDLIKQYKTILRRKRECFPELYP